MRVEVRDAQGAAATVRTTIEVALEPEVPIGFRAAAGAVTNGTSIAPRVPSSTEPGDALLLWPPTGWSAPVGVATRLYLGTSGSGRVTTLVADSSGPVDSPTYGGLTAVASQSGSMATMWSIALTQG